MEQWTPAVKAFQAAYRAKDFRRRAAEGLAQAFLGRGDALLAHRAIRVVLADETAADDPDVLGLLYWQARAAEALSRTSEAVDLYERVAVQDAQFLDALDRLKRLTP